jgi:hypothetical protein
MKTPVRTVRIVMTIIALLQLLIAVGFFTRQAWTEALWPFMYTSNLSFTFMSSMALAAAASTLWCVFEREEAGFAGIALDYIPLFGAMCILGFQNYSRTQSQPVLTLVIGSAVTAVFGLWLFLWSQRLPFRDSQPTPRPVLFAFGFFAVALIITGGAMVLRQPNILPWDMTQETALFYGWFFLGAAVYFIYGLIRRTWGNAGGQLAGFLAYDLVLIVPFLQHLSNVRPEHRLSLYFYIFVVTFSGLLAIYYLFLNPKTRMGRRNPIISPSRAVSEASAV